MRMRENFGASYWRTIVLLRITNYSILHLSATISLTVAKTTFADRKHSAHKAGNTTSFYFRDQNKVAFVFKSSSSSRGQSEQRKLARKYALKYRLTATRLRRNPLIKFLEWKQVTTIEFRDALNVLKANGGKLCIEKSFCTRNILQCSCQEGLLCYTYYWRRQPTSWKEHLGRENSTNLTPDLPHSQISNSTHTC